jgi:alcohol dehydrogenase class IV
MALRFNYPTTILYGPGAVGDLAAHLAPGPNLRFLLVTDPGIAQAGLVERVLSRLGEAGLKVSVFSEVHPNPIEEDVERGVAALRAADAAGLIALGGGSPIDVAKAIAVLAHHEGPLSRYDDAQGGDRHIVHPLPPVYAIPTTAGTGSEVGRSAVIIARDTGLKTVIFHPGLMPRIAVLDPELTVGLPPHLTAATGLDAFTHGLESYFARGFHPLADAIALGCLELVIENLPRAVERGDDLEARGRMLVAATMGATAFQKGLGLVHSLAHPLSAHYGIHHGLANALLMPVALAWQIAERAREFSDDLRGRYRRVVRLFPGREGADWRDLPEAIAVFRMEVGIRETLPDLGLKREDIPTLAAEAFKDPCHTQNPIPVTEADLAAVYERALTFASSRTSR